MVRLILKYLTIKNLSPILFLFYIFQYISINKMLSNVLNSLIPDRAEKKKNPESIEIYIKYIKYLIS